MYKHILFNTYKDDILICFIINEDIYIYIEINDIHKDPLCHDCMANPI